MTLQIHVRSHEHSPENTTQNPVGRDESVLFPVLFKWLEELRFHFMCAIALSLERVHCFRSCWQPISLIDLEASYKILMSEKGNQT